MSQSRISKKPQTKSSYCEYYKDCDRPENCFKGEFCPLFKFNPDISPEASKDSAGEDGFADIMDKIWDGDENITKRKI